MYVWGVGTYPPRVASVCKEAARAVQTVARVVSLSLPNGCSLLDFSAHTYLAARGWGLSCLACRCRSCRTLCNSSQRCRTSTCSWRWRRPRQRPQQRQQERLRLQLPRPQKGQEGLNRRPRLRGARLLVVGRRIGAAQLPPAGPAVLHCSRLWQQPCMAAWAARTPSVWLRSWRPLQRASPPRVRPMSRCTQPSSTPSRTSSSCPWSWARSGGGRGRREEVAQQQQPHAVTGSGVRTRAHVCGEGTREERGVGALTHDNKHHRLQSSA